MLVVGAVAAESHRSGVGTWMPRLPRVTGDPIGHLKLTPRFGH